jgi:NAD(P)H dehydrogenase (quinone)
MRTTLVTGATGPLGRAVATTMAKSTDPATIRLLVRNPEKAADLESAGFQIVPGDYNDDPGLLKAMQGIDTVFLVSGSDIENRAAQHHNVTEAAMKNGVQKIIYVSLQRKDDSVNRNLSLPE